MAKGKSLIEKVGRDYGQIAEKARALLEAINDLETDLRELDLQEKLAGGPGVNQYKGIYRNVWNVQFCLRNFMTRLDHQN